jgi:hypothetical protein
MVTDTHLIGLTRSGHPVWVGDALFQGVLGEGWRSEGKMGRFLGETTVLSQTGEPYVQIWNCLGRPTKV